MNKATRILCAVLAAAAISLFAVQLSCRSALHRENKLVIAVAYDGDNNHIEVQNLKYISPVRRGLSDTVSRYRRGGGDYFL